MTHAFVQSPLSSHQRYRGLLYGALVADALALGAHWLYDQNEIAGRFGRVAEFLPPARDDYHPGKLRGAQTHYGDQTLVLLESLDACDGNFVMEDFAQRWSWFWRESKAYRDHATKITLAHLEESFDPPRAGSDSTDLGGAVRIAPLLAALRNEKQPTNIAAAREQTMLTHAAPVTMDAAEFLTRMVFLLMRGESVASALQTTAALPSEALPVEAMLRQAESTHDLPTIEAVAHLGLSCPLEKSFPAVFAILLRHGDNIETALVENVMAGGDSAARGMALGIILGAAHGYRAIPERWIEGLLARSRVESYLKTMELGRE